MKYLIIFLTFSIGAQALETVSPIVDTTHILTIKTIKVSVPSGKKKE